jgi:hypothetical protein
MGESGTGKTGSLISLADAGFTLHILDLEAKAEDLIRTIVHDAVESNKWTAARAAACLSSIEIEVAAETPAFSGDQVKIKTPQALKRAGEILTAWGAAKFDRSHIIVIDSFSRLSIYAANVIAKQVGHEPEFRDFRDIFNKLRPLLGYLTAWQEQYEGSGEQFDCHIIVLTNVNMYEVRRKTGEKTKVGAAKVDETEVIDTRIYPKAIGQALSPDIPAFFNSMLVYRAARNKPGSRVIQLLADDMTPVKTPAISFAEKTKQLPVETGLATYFAACNATPPEQTNA